MMNNECIYQADPQTVQMLQRIRENIHHSCRLCMNRKVRVQTIDGQVYDGMIENVDHQHLYLRVPQTDAYRQFIPGFYASPTDVILPLVLYELLVISLLS